MQVMASRRMDAKSPSCAAFSPDGYILAIGFSSGELRLLDALSLLPVAETTVFKCVPAGRHGRALTLLAGC